jgi:ferric-dicitrate binding protein FerR (iron transport regulator)
MSDEILRQQITDLINGTISETAHQELQDHLKSDARARVMFRERMDLEAGLRTWAADGLIDEQPAVNQSRPTDRLKHSWWRWKVTLPASAALILALAFWWTQQPGPAAPGVAEQPHQADPQDSTRTTMLVGRLVQQADCIWEQGPSLQEDRFSPGMIKLTSGAAELRFDSGTNVILEGPCELKIETVDSAELLAGTVFVDVTEISNGFLLETPEAQIIDDGTQYAVSLDSQATEVHVFDGSVIWTSAEAESDFEERIPSGEARRYLRRDPGRSRHIPFGQRQFVQRIEESVRDAGGGDLIAYDGFENLVGQLRRGRSGFGWSGGWESAGRGRGPLAEVVDAPDDVVFGLDRSGRRLLSLRGGDDLRRSFERPLGVSPGRSIFLSLLISRRPSDAEEDTEIQIVLEPQSVSRRYQRRHSVSYGVTSQGEPFVNNAGTIVKVPMELSEEVTFLLILKYTIGRRGTSAGLRVYNPGPAIDLMEPTVWTEANSSAAPPPNFSSLRIAAAQSRDWLVDELKIGGSWSAVVATVPGANTAP